MGPSAAPPASSPFRPTGEACPLCGGRSLRPFTAQAFDTPSRSGVVSIIECRDCEFAWQWPLVRSPEESVTYFAESYQGRNESGYFDPDEKRRIAELELGFVEECCPQRGRLLDVGAGSGVFCELAAERGWHATGIDPAGRDLEERQHGRGRVRLLRGSFDRLDADPGFDVVTMWDVIEHVEEPLALFERAHAVLRPGGSVFVETGNYQSAARIEGGDTWWCYCHDHRWYHTPPAIERLLRHAGFGDVRLCDRVLRPGWSGSQRYPGPSRSQFLKACLAHPDRLPRLAAQFRELRRAPEKWPRWSGLEIFCVWGRRPS